MNQLLWYYADLEKQKCLLEMNEEGGADNDSDFIAHLGGRRSNKVRRDSYYTWYQQWAVRKEFDEESQWVALMGNLFLHRCKQMQRKEKSFVI